MESLSTESTTEDLKGSKSNSEVDDESRRRRKILRGELARMQERENNAKARQKAHRDVERANAKEQMRKKRVEKGITILPEVTESRDFVKHIVKEETKIAVESQRKLLDAETDRMTSYIDHKLGISDLPKGEELQALAKDFYRNDHIPNDHLPDHIRRELTTEEINDFRIVFDMFDAKNKGYITAEDLRRAAAMLGYVGKKKVFKEMIESTSKDKKGRVTFINFLDLVVKMQGDGPDPFDEIVQFFQMLDKENKGFVTFNDLRRAADEVKVSLSNKALREMMHEANTTGNGKITLEEFKQTMLLTGTFRAFVMQP